MYRQERLTKSPTVHLRLSDSSRFKVLCVAFRKPLMTVVVNCSQHLVAHARTTRVSTLLGIGQNGGVTRLNAKMNTDTDISIMLALTLDFLLDFVLWLVVC